eukprot:scaffold227668_cov27-Tisochrysis_lutea.AAC.4
MRRSSSVSLRARAASSTPSSQGAPRSINCSATLRWPSRTAACKADVSSGPRASTLAPARTSTPTVSVSPAAAAATKGGTPPSRASTSADPATRRRATSALALAGGGRELSSSASKRKSSGRLLSAERRFAATPPSSRARTARAWPFSEATCIAHSPFQFCCGSPQRRLAPCRNNIATLSACPRPAAVNSGVAPCCASRALGSAPCASNTLRTAAWPP